MALLLVGGVVSPALAQAPVSSLTSEANAKLQVFRESCQTPKQNGLKPTRDDCDALAFDAASTYRDAHLPAKSIAAFRMFLVYDLLADPHSPLVPEAHRQIAELYRAICAYDLAADWLERFQHMAPIERGADRALEDAITLRLGLGQLDMAARDANEYVRGYVATRPSRAAGVVIVMANALAADADWSGVLVLLDANGPLLARAPVDVVVQAHGLRGRALLAGAPEHTAPAYEAFEKAHAAFLDAGSPDRALALAWPDDDEEHRARRLANTLGAEGEALFQLAERTRARELSALPPPVHAGPATDAALMRHLQVAVPAWASARRAAILRVEQAYLRVVDMQPSAPPRWRVDAYAAIAATWADHADELGRVVPAARMPANAAPRKRVAEAISVLRTPILQEHARPMMRRCMDISSQLQLADDASRGCETWLARNRPGEFHAGVDLAQTLRPAAPLPWPPQHP